MGKVLFRAQECYGDEEGTMGGRDVILSGDPRQAEPVIDEPFFKRGRYEGKGRNAPRNSEAPAGAPSMEALVHRAELFRQEFEGEEGDAVILREAHRIDRGEGRGLSGAELEKFGKEADKFQEVTGRMASCEWTRAEHEWLSRRTGVACPQRR